MLLVLNALKQYENKAPFPLDKKLPKIHITQLVNTEKHGNCVWVGL
jgi:hypothetical protein